MAIGLPDEDTLEGVQAYWNADSVLPTAVPGDLGTGRLLKPSGIPWARVECRQGLEKNNGPAPQVSGATYHDYRVVTFSVWGPKSLVVAALIAVANRFENQPKGGTPLTVSNSSVMRMQPLYELDSLGEDPTKREGQDLWVGVKAYQLWTLRTLA